ncbi:MAG: DNA-directed RNA polymerase subunit beta [Athalassotoga sp.]|uniref:DNA-directed RNA polymerase subunit beta n=1 Tax=Athalassotoga sp. TaxID=2022597 RepID=UPI003D071F9F
MEKRERYSYGRMKDAIEVPNLISVQLDSYKDFVENGIMEVLKKFSPIESKPHKADVKKSEKGFRLEFVRSRTGEPKYTEEECRLKDTTYSVPLYITIRIKDTHSNEIKESEALFGYLPIMTERGTFIINGAERVVVHQLVRSPGVYFVREFEGSERIPTFFAHFLPEKGAWLEILLNTKKGLLQARIDRKKKIKLPILLKILGFVTPMEMLKIYPIMVTADEDELIFRKDSIILEDIKDQSGKVIVEAGQKISEDMIHSILESKVQNVTIAHPYMQKTVENLDDNEKIMTSDDAYIEFFRKLRPGEIPRINVAKSYFNSLYFDPEHYDLTEIGRTKINAKLGLKLDSRVLTKDDIITAIKYLIDIENHEERLDTKDHLGNKRVRTAGELLKLEFERGFSRVQKMIEDKLNMYNSLDKINIQSLINVRAVMATLQQFFASSQLSQFMDQVNPLAELTHKRRISALGPGGLRRERARFEVRDVHHSHYGRMCPIETPEGANIGLITSMSIFAEIDKYGFLRTPYRKIENGRITSKIDYLMADEESNYNIAPVNVKINPDGTLADERVSVRFMETYRYVARSEVDYIDVSSKQIVSVSAALIPFLENDDANRALMGSNMQRQGVPLVKPQAPLIGTGMEKYVARDSGFIVIAKNSGKVKKVSSTEIIVERDDGSGEDVYHLIKYARTNQDTCINQIPIVDAGEHVEKGDCIADGPATDMGELALGRNVLVAFMPWEGYNFEDAIVINQSLIEEDAFTSVHIEAYETYARETRLGPEEITADIPNASKELLKNLDENGIVRVGSLVHPKDILVGKVTPKGDSELTAEEKIMRSIFGERGRDVKDTSLKLPHGVDGRVIGVHIFEKGDISELDSSINKMVKVYVATRKPLAVGDKLAGRHGNKGVVSRIVPKEDMPFLPDGTPVEMILSPLGVPSRMNIGQVLETHLGWLAKLKGMYFATPVFDGAKEEDIFTPLYEERKKFSLTEGDNPEYPTGKVVLRDGRTGEPFNSPVVVGVMYMMKLIHIAQDKIHARSIGPYSLIHQQPLGGKAQFGGQRFGEMEVWALEAHGAAHTLQEMLTIKSDDIEGRNEAYKAIMRGKNIPLSNLPESFKVLVKELQGLALDVKVYDDLGNEIKLDR